MPRKASGNRARFRQVVEPFLESAQSHGLRAQFDDQVMQFGFRHQRIHIIPPRPLRAARRTRGSGRGGRSANAAPSRCNRLAR